LAEGGGLHLRDTRFHPSHLLAYRLEQLMAFEHDQTDQLCEQQQLSSWA
jgi:hypothetical protein